MRIADKRGESRSIFFKIQGANRKNVIASPASRTTQFRDKLFAGRGNPEIGLFCPNKKTNSGLLRREKLVPACC